MSSSPLIPAFVTYAELQQFQEQNPQQQRLVVLAEFLLEAVTNWPAYGLQEPEEPMTVLQQEVGVPLTYERLRQHVSWLQLPDAWKKVAISSLAHLFEAEQVNQIDTTSTLLMVLEQLTTQWRATRLL